MGQEYSRNCMLKRNRYLVEHSTILLAVYNGLSDLNKKNCTDIIGLSISSKETSVDGFDTLL